jgi:hypothetical protein
MLADISGNFNVMELLIAVFTGILALLAVLRR